MSNTPIAPSTWQACLFWLKLGCFSFGTLAGQITTMHQELVERRHWISAN
jgi:chromate transporter